MNYSHHRLTFVGFTCLMVLFSAIVFNFFAFAGKAIDMKLSTTATYILTFIGGAGLVIFIMCFPRQLHNRKIFERNLSYLYVGNITSTILFFIFWQQAGLSAILIIFTSIVCVLSIICIGFVLWIYSLIEWEKHNKREVAVMIEK